MAEPRLFDQSSLKPRLGQAFDFAARQVRLTVERTPDYFPIYTVGGRWLQRGELWTDWCGGFHAGMMWLVAGRTSESWWRRTAEHYSGRLEHRQHDRTVHDLGFLFLNTYLPWLRATGDERLLQQCGVRPAPRRMVIAMWAAGRSSNANAPRWHAARLCARLRRVRPSGSVGSDLTPPAHKRHAETTDPSGKSGPNELFSAPLRA